MSHIITDQAQLGRFMGDAASGDRFTTKVSRADSASIATWKRSLTGFFGTILEALIPSRNLSLFVQPVQVSGEMDKRTGYHQVRGLGDPQPVRGIGSNIARVAVVGKETLLEVETFALAAGWTWQEQQSAIQASRAGLSVPVDTSQIIQMGKSFERKANDLGFFGDDDLDIQGIFNNTNIKQYGLVDSTGAAVTISSASSNASIREAVGIFIDRAEIETDGAIRTNVVGFCKEAYSYLKNTQNSDASDTSLLTWLRNTHSGVQFLDVNELSKGYQDRLFGTTGRIADDYMLGVDTTMPGWLQSMPMGMTMLPLRDDGVLGFVLPAVQRIGGVHCPTPAGVSIAKNVLGRRAVTGS